MNRKYYVTGGVGSGDTLGGLRRRLRAAQQRLLRILLELRPRVLPVQAEPRLPRRAVRRSLRGDDVQRAAWARSISMDDNFYLHEPAGRAAERARWHTCPCCVGNIPRTLLMMPDVDVRRKQRGRAVRESVRRQPHSTWARWRARRSRWSRRRTTRGTARSRSRVNPQRRARRSPCGCACRIARPARCTRRRRR